MKNEILHLKDFYPFLGEDGKDPLLEINLRYNISEMKRKNIKRPCLIVCPGGGYAFCSQREAEPIAANFWGDGYNTFTIWYSVSPHRYPTQLLEVAAVMELIYKNADEWNCDTDRISIVGFSAGGHLAAHYSNSYNCNEVRKYFPDSKRVNATLLSYPVICADKPFSHFGSFENLLGYLPKGKEAEKFSCDKLVTENTPPTFIWHTAEDNCVPVENSLTYAAALSDSKVPFELHIYPFGYHGLATADAETNDNLDPKFERCSEWTQKAKEWLKMMLG